VVQVIRRSAGFAFASLADEVRGAVGRELVRVLDGELARAAADESTVRVLGAVRSLTMRGGKRLRPALLAAGYVAAGGESTAPQVAIAGAAIELLQSYLLIHDDWMDGSPTRRGGPAAHVMLGDWLGPTAKAHEPGAAAILAGDYAAALSQRVLLEVPAEAQYVLAAAGLLADVHRDVVRGQVLDMFSKVNNVDEIERVYALKTAGYTVAGPLAIGAVLAGGTALALSLAAIGRPLGIAFQLQDDLLGLFGSEAATGKPVGADLRDGKRTWLMGEVMSTERGRALVASAFGKRDASDEVIAHVVSELRSDVAVGACRARIVSLCGEARRGVEALPIASGARELLFGAIHVLTERDA
jgi:geranylgeranyl diphosphate synthase type I